MARLIHGFLTVSIPSLTTSMGDLVLEEKSLEFTLNSIAMYVPMCFSRVTDQQGTHLFMPTEF